jgi:hypothetical protein
MKKLHSFEDLRLIHTQHAVPMPFVNSHMPRRAPALLQQGRAVRVVAGNIRTASPTFWRRERSPDIAVIQTPEHPAHTLVTVPTLMSTGN